MGVSIIVVVAGGVVIRVYFHTIQNTIHGDSWDPALTFVFTGILERDFILICLATCSQTDSLRVVWAFIFAFRSSIQHRRAHKNFHSSCMAFISWPQCSKPIIINTPDLICNIPSCDVDNCWWPSCHHSASRPVSPNISSAMVAWYAAHEPW